MSTTIQCDLLTYRNLTMSTLLHPVGVTATVDVTSGQSVEGHVDLGSVKVSVGQETVHTLNSALRAMAQVCNICVQVEPCLVQSLFSFGVSHQLRVHNYMYA